MKRAKHRFSIFGYTVLMMVAVLSFNACSKDEPDSLFTFVAPLSGASAMPPNNTTAEGYCNATYDSISNYITYTITWRNLSGPPIAVNLQVPAVAGGFTNIPVTGFPAEITNGVSGSVNISQADEAALLNNKFFVNIITTNYSDGEIRGQLEGTK